MKDAVAFYRLASDFATRDENAGQEVLPILAKSKPLASYDELNAQLPEFILNGIQLPFAFDIDSDMKNAKMNTLLAYPPATILPDKTYYTDHPQAEELLQSFLRQCCCALNEIREITIRSRVAGRTNTGF